jgi:hypothetical protein
MVTEQIIEEMQLTPEMLKTLRDRTIEEVTATFNLFINQIEQQKEEQ